MRSGVPFILHLVYHLIQVYMPWVCSSRQTAGVNVDAPLCDYEKQNESVPSKGILVINKPVVCAELRFEAS